MAHTFDTSSAQAKTTANPIAFNYTCGEGATLLVLSLMTGGTTIRSGGDPTYNGTPFISGGARTAGSETNSEQWYYINPPTGSALSISIPNAGGLNISVVASSYKAGSGKTSFHRETITNVGSTANPAGSSHTGTVAGMAIVACIGTGDNSFSPTARRGYSLLERDDGSYGVGNQYYFTSGTADISMFWTEATASDWSIVSSLFTEVIPIVVVTGNAGLSGVGSQIYWALNTALGRSFVSGNGILDNLSFIDIAGQSNLSSSSQIVLQSLVVSLLGSSLSGYGELSSSAFNIALDSVLLSGFGELVSSGEVTSVIVADAGFGSPLFILGLSRKPSFVVVTGNAYAYGLGSLSSNAYQLSLGSTILYVFSDVDSDGYLELIASSGLDGTSQLSVEALQSSYGSTLLYALTDINGDGQLELVALSSLFGSSNLTSQAFQTAFGSTLMYLLSDLDGDGYLELISSSSLFGLGNALVDSKFALYIYALSHIFGNGTLSSSGYQQSFGSTFLYSLSDIDGDGQLDIIASSSMSGVGNLIGIIEAVVSEYIAYFIGSGQLSADGQQTAYGLTLLYTLSDIDGDGNLEISVDTSLSGYGYASSSGYQTAYGDTLLSVLADLDGDGQLEIVSQSSLSGSGNLYSEILRVLLESGAFIGSGSLSSTSQLVVYASSGLSADGVLDSEALQQLLASLSLHGTGGLSSGSLSLILDSGVLSGTGDMSVIGDLIQKIVYGCVALFDLLLHNVIVSENDIYSVTMNEALHVVELLDGSIITTDLSDNAIYSVDISEGLCS